MESPQPPNTKYWPSVQVQITAIRKKKCAHGCLNHLALRNINKQIPNFVGLNTLASNVSRDNQHKKECDSKSRNIASWLQLDPEILHCQSLRRIC